jgi:hypothetical protein
MLWGDITNIGAINNISYTPSSYAIDWYQTNMHGCLVDHNLVSGASTMMGGKTGCSVINTVFGNPNFVNPGAANFETQAAAPESMPA